MTLPALCDYHRPLYATKAARLRKRVHHPGHGRKALEREAENIARACLDCPDPKGKR